MHRTWSDTKAFIPLENNPQILTKYAHSIGLPPSLSFHEVLSLNDPDLLVQIPRPCSALLAIIPGNPTWVASCFAEDSSRDEYAASGPDEPVLWFKQTIRNACGSVGLIHCVANAPEVRRSVIKGSLLDRIIEDAIPLAPPERAELLYQSRGLEDAHMAAARRGDTVAPPAEIEAYGHFVAFVKGVDGRLWELEGGRKGPVGRGVLEEGEDALSERAVALGLGRVIEFLRDEGKEDLGFSVVALGPSGE